MTIINSEFSVIFLTNPDPGQAFANQGSKL